MLKTSDVSDLAAKDAGELVPDQLIIDMVKAEVHLLLLLLIIMIIIMIMIIQIINIIILM